MRPAPPHRFLLRTVTFALTAVGVAPIAAPPLAAECAPQLSSGDETLVLYGVEEFDQWSVSEAGGHRLHTLEHFEIGHYRGSDGRVVRLECDSFVWLQTIE